MKGPDDLLRGTPPRRARSFGASRLLGDRFGRLSPELATTILAVGAVPLSVFTQVPAWGIFLGWSAASLFPTRAPATQTLRVLILCLTFGGVCGAVMLLLQDLAFSLAAPGTPPWLCSVAILIPLNPLMLFVARSPAFASVPGIFIGFSTAAALGSGAEHFGWGDAASVAVAGILSNCIGVGISRLFTVLTVREGMLEVPVPRRDKSVEIKVDLR
ncbi:DUF1097 family protein [Arthrobacter sp. NPDC090010]|uniref:DUF1097 family protein n=1 Tax=Arthrobacter sp. NPDC090010 TaxID=3363942 RepID=UPI0038084403